MGDAKEGANFTGTISVSVGRDGSSGIRCFLETRSEMLTTAPFQRVRYPYCPDRHRIGEMNTSGIEFVYFSIHIPSGWVVIGNSDHPSSG
ncbi:MAG: hypothetical protein ACYCYP_12490 [Leptospirales bacterium]